MRDIFPKVNFTQNVEYITGAMLPDEGKVKLFNDATSSAIGPNHVLGARSRIVEQLGLPLVGQHGLGNVFNVLCEIDLSEYVAHRHASLYSVIQPGSSYWAPVAVFRMVRAWDQWLVGLIVPHAAGKPEPRLQDFEERVRELVGHPTLALRILS